MPLDNVDRWSKWMDLGENSMLKRAYNQVIGFYINLKEFQYTNATATSTVI